MDVDCRLVFIIILVKSYDCLFPLCSWLLLQAVVFDWVWKLVLKITLENTRLFIIEEVQALQGMA